MDVLYEWKVLVQIKVLLEIPWTIAHILSIHAFEYADCLSVDSFNNRPFKVGEVYCCTVI